MKQSSGIIIGRLLSTRPVVTARSQKSQIDFLIVALAKKLLNLVAARYEKHGLFRSNLGGLYRSGCCFL